MDYLPFCHIMYFDRWLENNLYMYIGTTCQTLAVGGFFFPAVGVIRLKMYFRKNSQWDWSKEYTDYRLHWNQNLDSFGIRKISDLGRLLVNTLNVFKNCIFDWDFYCLFFNKFRPTFSKYCSKTVNHFWEWKIVCQLNFVK
jgi:hypothetical protein